MSVFPFAPAATTSILRVCGGAFILCFILCGSTEGQIQRIFRALRGEPAPVEMQAVGEAAFAVADEVAIAVEEGPEAEAKGPLADMAPVLKQAATLVVRDDRLVVDELASSNEFQQAMYSNSHLFGGGGTSSSSNGKNWKMSFNWQLLKGRAEFSTGEATQMLIDATEQGGQLKHMRYEITGEESIELMLWSPRTPEFLRLKQEGALLTIVFVQGEVTLSVRGTSLSETLRKIPADSRPAMLASLRSTGFPLPPTPYDSAIVEGLIEKLTSSLDPDEATIFAELASGFDDDDYTRRQETSDQITGQFKRWEAHIAAALEDDAFSLEAQSRLREIYRANAAKENAAVADAIASLDLQSNPDYLVWLLTQTEVPEQRQLIAAELERLTGESLGPELEAWQQWLADQNPAGDGVAESASDGIADASATEKNDPLVTEGQLNLATESVSRIARFRFAANSIQLDSSLWREPLGDKTIAQVNQDIKQQLQELHLPASLWQGDSLANQGEAAYPIAALMALESEIQKIKSPQGHHMRNSNTYGSNPNPSFDISGLSFALQTQQNQNVHRRGFNRAANAGGQAAPERFFHFQVSESTQPYRQLRYGKILRSQQFYVGYFDPSANYMLSITGSPKNGWWLHRIWEESIEVAHAETPAGLYAEKGALFDEQVLPLLTKLGVQIIDDRDVVDEPPKP